MISVIKKAREHHRNAIEQLYEDTCTVIEYKSIKDSITKVTNKQEVIVLTDQPCKLSFSSSNTASEGENVTTVSQTIKLFLSNDVEILVGSKLIVIHDEKESVYKSSGAPNRYFTHQEIMLDLFNGWA